MRPTRLFSISYAPSCKTFLLEQKDRPVVRQHRYPARGSIRIRRGAEDGTRNAFNGRLGHANGEGANLPVDNIFWFLEQMTIN